jgi:hypothetical protein
MARKIKSIPAKIYRLEYAEDEGVSDAEYDTFPAKDEAEAMILAQEATNRAQVALQLFQRIDGMNFHIVRLEPIFED